MVFTREDILKILNALLQLGRKDSEFKDANTPLNSNDEIAILLDGVNKKVSINNLLSTLGLLKKEDFINVSDRYDEYYILLSEAITIIANNKRKKGLVITFLDLHGDWKILQFDGELDNFSNTDYWKDLFDFKYPIVNSILPDEEDLTLTLPDKDNNSFIKLKDKEYDTTNFSGMGTKIIRKNIIKITLDDDTIKRINYLSPDIFNSENIIYEIRYDFDLNGLTVNIPNNCVLKFNGGNIYNGTIVGNNTTMINFVDEILTKNSCKYLGSFVSNIVYHYNNIEDIKNKNHFPGQHLLTYSYYKGDTAGGDYLVITTLQGIEDNLFFLNYWASANPVCKTGLYTKIYNNLWIKYVTRSSTVNIGIFGIKFDANYYKDGLWYSDEECTLEATDNAYYFQNAIGLLQWWALGNIPRYIYIPSRFVINSPIKLHHGSHAFTLIGNPYFVGEITTNRKIECLMYNVYGENTISNLTGNTYNIDGIKFNGNNLAYDCLVLKNGYEADCIKNCLFNNAKCSGVRCWGISSTFKLFNISTFENGEYGLLLCENWTYNNIKYYNRFEGVASFYGVSGDNNKLGLVGIDISESFGASINIQHLKCEDRLNEDNCAIRVINSAEAMDVNITNAFTDANCPFIILEKLTVLNGTFRLNSVFNNFNFKTESELPNSTIIIDDRFRNKKVYNHAKGSSCVNMIYTTHYDSKTFHHGLALYRQGDLVGGLCGELEIPNYTTYANLVNYSNTSKYLISPIQVTDYDNNVAFKLDNKFKDSLGRDFYAPIKSTVEINNNNQYKTIYLSEVDTNDILKCTLSTTSYVGKIDIFLAAGNTPQYLVKSYNIDTDTTSTFYFTRNRLKEGYFTLILHMYNSNSTGTVSIKIIRNASIVPLLSNIEGIVSPTVKRIGTSQEREYGYNGFMYVDTTLNRPIYYLNNKWINSEGVTADTNHFGNFANKPTVANNLIPIGFKYFCTDKQTSEGATNGIEIIHKGNDVWVDTLGRTIV